MMYMLLSGIRADEPDIVREFAQRIVVNSDADAVANALDMLETYNLGGLYERRIERL